MYSRIRAFVCILLCSLLLGSSKASGDIIQVLTEDGMYLSTDNASAIFPLSSHYYQIEEIQPSIWRITLWLEGTGERCAIYNEKLNITTEFCFLQAYGADIETDPILVLDESGFYYIDCSLNPISPQRYYDAQPFSCGLAWIQHDETEGKFINQSGEGAFKMNADYLYDTLFFDNLCLVFDTISGKYGYIDLDGFVSIPILYDYADQFRDGYACVISDGGEYLLDVEGNLHSIAPYHFAWGDGFSEDRLLVEKDGLYGYLDSSLQLVIPCIFTWADTSFLNGVAEVEINGERLYIDKYGSIVE